MYTGQVVTDSLPRWSPNSQELNDNFSRMVFSVDTDFGTGVISLQLSALIPINREVFNWEAAERRADWEESHGRFVEFSNVKDLLSDLHS